MPEFRFRNAVHLADRRGACRKRIDYVVWQKPYVQTSQGTATTIGADTGALRTALRAKFGTPAFEDSTIIAFHVASHARTMLNGKRIVVVMPAYHAGRTLEATWRELPREIVDDVIVVDDAQRRRHGRRRALAWRST